MSISYFPQVLVVVLLAVMVGFQTGRLLTLWQLREKPEKAGRWTVDRFKREYLTPAIVAMITTIVLRLATAAVRVLLSGA